MRSVTQVYTSLRSGVKPRLNQRGVALLNEAIPLLKGTWIDLYPAERRPRRQKYCWLGCQNLQKGGGDPEKAGTGSIRRMGGRRLPLSFADAIKRVDVAGPSRGAVTTNQRRNEH